MICKKLICYCSIIVLNKKTKGSRHNSELLVVGNWFAFSSGGQLVHIVKCPLSLLAGQKTNFKFSILISRYRYRIYCKQCQRNLHTNWKVLWPNVATSHVAKLENMTVNVTAQVKCVSLFVTKCVRFYYKTEQNNPKKQLKFRKQGYYCKPRY